MPKITKIGCFFHRVVQKSRRETFFKHIVCFTRRVYFLYLRYVGYQSFLFFSYPTRNPKNASKVLDSRISNVLFVLCSVFCDRAHSQSCSLSFCSCHESLCVTLTLVFMSSFSRLLFSPSIIFTPGYAGSPLVFQTPFGDFCC